MVLLTPSAYLCPDLFTIIMKLKKNLVSVILPVNNAETHLAECLTSLLLQTYKDIEVIAVDDLSKDQSWNILKQFAKQDKRLKIHRNIKKYGLTVTLNRAVKHARGNYLAFMRATDKSHLKRIEKQVRFLSENQKTVAVGVQVIHTSRDTRQIQKSTLPLTHEVIYPTFLQANSFHFESALINRSILPIDVIKFTETTYPHVYSDLLVKLTRYGQLANCNYHLYTHREDLIEEKKKQSQKDTIEATLKLWIKSVTEYDYRPTLRSFFTQLAK